MLSPLVLGAIDPAHAPLDQGQLAVLAAVATFAGGGLAGLAGQNAMGGATAAQNEALNNSADHWGKNESEAHREQDALHKQQSKEKAQLGEGSIVDEGDGVSVLSPNPVAFGGAKNSAGFTIEPKIAGQMGTRGWTSSSIASTIANPSEALVTQDTRLNPTTGTRRNDPATAYINADGSYVVVNNKDGTVVQVSNRNNPNWKAPWAK